MKLIEFLNGLGTIRSWFKNENTEERTYTFPDKDGTVAMLDDISTATFVTGEVPSGLVNGSNTAYTLAATPVAGSVKIYLNGLRLKATVDYNISGVNITMVTAPSTGDLLLSDYRV